MSELTKWRSYVDYKPSIDRTAYEGNLGAYLLEACQEIERLTAEGKELRAERDLLRKQNLAGDAAYAALRQQLALAEAWLKAEDAFTAHMDKADTSTWHPGYGDEVWTTLEQTREAFRASLPAKPYGPDNECRHYIPDPQERCAICHPEIRALQAHSGDEPAKPSGDGNG